MKHPYTLCESHGLNLFLRLYGRCIISSNFKSTTSSRGCPYLYNNKIFTCLVLQYTLTGLNPVGKYGPTGEITTNSFALVGALTPKVSSVAINVGLRYAANPGSVGIQS